MNQELQNFNYLFDKIKHLMRTAVLLAGRVNDALFTDRIEKRMNEVVATAFLGKASAKMAAAEALYHSNYELLANDETEAVFTQFDVFSDEVLVSFCEDHSHQWSNIEYNRLMELFDDCPYAMESVANDSDNS